MSWGHVVDRFKSYYKNIKVTIRENVEKLGVDSKFLKTFGIEAVEDAKRGDLNGISRRLENNPDIKINTLIHVDSRGDDYSYQLCPNCKTRNKLKGNFCINCGTNLKQ